MPSEFVVCVCEILDNWARDMTPHGVAINARQMLLTNQAFDYYIAKYGVPHTANEARHMFEWASALETTWTLLSGITENKQP